MGKHKAQSSASARTLASTQVKHAKQLKKVENARARLEKATLKLHTLEAKLAALSKAAHDAQANGVDTPPQAAPKLREAMLIFNPNAKGAHNQTYRAEEIVDCLRTHGIAASLRMKTSGKVAHALAKEAVDRGLELVIVAGGDGTIEDVFPKLLGSNTALGIIPLGTMNNIARSLGIPLDLEQACTLLGMGISRHIDVGRIISQQKPSGVYFLESAGVGLSALAAPLGQAAEKGRWELFMKSMGKMFAFQSAEVTVMCDEDPPIQAHTQVVTISNAPLLGKNMLVAPDAKADDGLFDVAVYDGMSKFELERHFLAIADGGRVDDPRISFRRARRVRVTADVPLEANADLGVLVGQPVWEIDVLPGALAAVVGKGIGLTMPVEAAPSMPPLAGPQILVAPAPASSPPAAPVASSAST